jgi:hypothetical protein
LFFSREELSVLRDVVEAIIPTTDTPGASAANVHGFIDLMMAHWALPETRTAFRGLLTAINARAREQFASEFVELSTSSQHELVATIDAQAFKSTLSDVESDVKSRGSARDRHPFVRLKELVFLGYYQSKIGATAELQFLPVPGSYKACIALSSTDRAGSGNMRSLIAVRSRLISQCGC